MRRQGKKLNNYKIYIVLVSFLILVQPFLDIYKSLVQNKMEFFGISIIEIINMLCIGGIVLITIILNRKKLNKKNIMILSITIIAYLIYIGLHIWNLLKFNTSLFPNNNINAFVEGYYIFRALLEPLILILCVYINKFPKKVFYNLISALTIIVSGLIVISNIFGFSLVAYSDTNKLISGNIFSWFTYTDSYVSTITSKGLFFSANELSNLMLILLPINIYNYIQKKNIKNYLIIAIQILSMIMLGTKTATLGAVAIIIGSICLTIIISIKEKISFSKYFKKYIMIYLLTIAFMPILYYSPLLLGYRNEVVTSREEEAITQVEKNNEIVIPSETDPTKKIVINIKDYDCNNITEEEKNYIIEFINKESYNFRINKYYLETYPSEVDPSFWCEMYRNRDSDNKNNREIKLSIFKRIMELNNRPTDKYVGLGYTLEMLVLETDYYQLFFQFGIFGLILFIGPYILIFAISIFKILKDLKHKFNYENILLLTSSFCGLASPHISGHLYGNTFISFALSITIIMLYIILKGENE